jgi:2-polyprenyl-3-methyl-5-hydroxy-6-metoxy-1,4-benzoquinol methylase
MDVSPANAKNIDAYSDVDDTFLSGWDPDGDDGRKYLLNPTIFRMLGPLSGQRVLDAGCGQGYLSRLMASAGASVTGVEPAGRFIEFARRSEESQPLGIEYFQRDLSRLGETDGVHFDAVVANMVLLDIADWESAVSNCLGALKPRGLFIFSLLHPCWTPDATTTWASHHQIELREYLQPYEVPSPHGVNYHRPLSDYLNFVLSRGANIIEVAEPVAPPELSEAASSDIGAHIPNFIVVSVESNSA